MTNHSELKFVEYANSIMGELKRRSQEAEKILQFPQLPVITKEMITLADYLRQNFDEYFLLEMDEYFIKNKYANVSIYNKKNGKIQTKIIKMARKVAKEDDEYSNRFLEFDQRPSIRNIKAFKEGNIQLRSHFLSVILIRQLKLNIVENDNQLTLLSSSCTCPDFHTYRVCIHLLALLIAKGHYDIPINLKKAKERGRKGKKKQPQRQNKR